MNRKTAAVFLLCAFLSGCAAYKELEPKPEILPIERGYIELKNDKDNFELDMGSKYYVKFPRPMGDHFDLVLVTPAKPFLRYYLTSRFDGQETSADRIPDQTPTNDSISVYPVNSLFLTYYWVIDTVSRDMQLPLRYRYVPEWRYTFETRFSQFKDILARNTVDRSTYNAIDANFNVGSIDLPREISTVSSRTEKLKGLKSDMDKLEAIFPKDIAASSDTAFEQYLGLRQRLDDEMNFQANYATLLSFFQKDSDTRGDVGGFLKAVPFFTGVVSQRDRFPARIQEKLGRMMVARLDELQPYYDNLLKTKEDITVITPEPSLQNLSALYRGIGQEMPAGLERVVRFVDRFNVEARGMAAVNSKFRDLRGSFSRNINAPSSTFFQDLLAGLGSARALIPESQANRFPAYGNSACAVKLGAAITEAVNKANDLQLLYTSGAAVATGITAKAWSEAESRLRALFNDRTLHGLPDVTEEMSLVVRRLENDIFQGVKQASEQRADAFVRLHEADTRNVAALYQDSAFLPVYQLGFSSLGAGDLAQKRKQIDDYLNGVKYVRFPESAIKTLWSSFSTNINDHGVEKARAIVDHGKFYRGNDEKVKALVNECDDTVPKWIVKAKEYRKVFVIPVTSNEHGVNEYMFRLRLNIPSEAQFPVFDINLKLPQEVALKAGTTQWYESVTIDRQPIKNEGRYRITAPMSSNNYESLITPVQMDKEGRNILEVKFKYPAFKVFEISAMAQVPIIRKN